MANDDLDKVELGEAALEFLQGKLGHALADQSERDKAEAVNELLGLEPYKIFELGELQAKIADIQLNYRTASRVGAYLRNFVIEGENALDIIHQNHEENY